MSERVLVIDFDRRECQRMAQELRDLGYEASTATSGAEVRERLSRGCPGLVLLDPMLPGEDGFKLCRELKRPDRANPPKIVVASRIFKGQRYRTMAERAGADVFLERPRQEQEILASIQRLLPTTASPSTVSDPVEAEPEEIVLDVSEAQDTPLAADESPSEALAPAPAPEPTAQPEAPKAAKPEPLPPEPPTRQTSRRDDDVPGFAEVTDDDIDDALQRALGGIGEAPKPPAAEAPPEAPASPAPAAVSTAPQGIQAAAPNEPKRGSVPEATAAPAPTDLSEQGTSEDDEDLTEALGDLGIELAPAAARSTTGPGESAPARREEAAPAADSGSTVGVLESPLSFDAPKTSGASIERHAETDGPPELELRSDLRTGTHAALDEQQPAASADPPSADAEPAPAKPEPVPPMDGPHRSQPPAKAPERAEGDDLDAMLDKAFAGTGPTGEPTSGEESSAEVEEGGPPAFSEAVKQASPPPVPDSLRGMDEGTADLLSSLEELDSSLPGTSETEEPSGWTSSGLTEDVTLGSDESPAQAQAPTPEEEASLDDVVEQLTGSDASASQAEPADGNEGDPASEEAASDPEEPPKRRRRLGLGWLFSFFVGVMAVGASGLLLLGDGGEPTTTPQRAEVEAEPPALAAGAGSTPSRSEGPSAEEPAPAPETSEASAGSDERSMRRIPNEPAETELAARQPDGAPAQTGPAETDKPVMPKPRPEPRPAALRQSGEEQAPARQGPVQPRSETEAVSPRNAPASPAGSEPREAARETEAVSDDSPVESESSPENAAAPTQGQRSPSTPDKPAPSEPPTRTAGQAPAQGSSDPPASKPVRPTPVVGLGDLDEPLSLLEAPTPSLAPEAREKGISGRVFVNLLIGPDGGVREVRVMIDPGYGLGRAAKQAAARWQFSKPRSHGRPVRVWKTEVVEFGVATGESGPER